MGNILMKIGAVALILNAVSGFAGTFEASGVKAENVTPHVVRVSFNGQSLGTFDADELRELSKGLSGAARLVKKMSTKEQLDALRNTPEGRKLLQAITGRK